MRSAKDILSERLENKTLYARLMTWMETADEMTWDQFGALAKEVRMLESQSGAPTLDVRTQLAGMLLVAEVRRMSVCRIGADEIAGAIGVTDKLLKALSEGGGK